MCVCGEKKDHQSVSMCICVCACMSVCVCVFPCLLIRFNGACINPSLKISTNPHFAFSLNHPSLLFLSTLPHFSTSLSLALPVCVLFISVLWISSVLWVWKCCVCRYALFVLLQFKSPFNWQAPPRLHISTKSRDQEENKAGVVNVWAFC